MRRKASSCPSRSGRRRFSSPGKRIPHLAGAEACWPRRVNSITSGSLFVTIASAVNGMVKSKEAALLILIGLSMTLMLGFWFFVTNVYMVISRRIFLEGRNFEIVPIQRFFSVPRAEMDEGGMDHAGQIHMSFVVIDGYWRDHQALFLLHGAIYCSRESGYFRKERNPAVQEDDEWA